MNKKQLELLGPNQKDYNDQKTSLPAEKSVFK